MTPLTPINPFEVAVVSVNGHQYGWLASLIVADMTTEYLRGELGGFSSCQTSVLLAMMGSVGQRPVSVPMNPERRHTPVAVLHAPLAGVMALLVDGTHRVSALAREGRETVPVYTVPVEREARYRLTGDELRDFLTHQLGGQRRALRRFIPALHEQALLLHDLGYSRCPHIEVPRGPASPAARPALPRPTGDVSLGDMLPLRFAAAQAAQNTFAGLLR